MPTRWDGKDGEKTGTEINKIDAPAPYYSNYSDSAESPFEFNGKSLTKHEVSMFVYISK